MQTIGTKLSNSLGDNGWPVNQKVQAPDGDTLSLPPHSEFHYAYTLDYQYGYSEM